MSRIAFTSASEYLAQQLQTGTIARRVGIVARVAFDNVADATQLLDDIFQNAWDKFDAAMDRMLADYTDENQRAAIEFSCVGSRPIPVERQLKLLMQGEHSPTVATAAASQAIVPFEVQQVLIEKCRDNKMAMAALARNSLVAPELALPLASHPDANVRLALAANVGPKLRLINETSFKARQAVYNCLLEHYTSDFAHYLVPVCKDSDQLAQMYVQTTKTAGNAQLFVENPYASEQLLLDISSSGALKILPGGAAVGLSAKKLLENRLDAEADIAEPRPY